MNFNRRSFLAAVGLGAPAAVLIPHLKAIKPDSELPIASKTTHFSGKWSEVELVKMSLVLLGVLETGEDPRESDYGFVAMQIKDGETPWTLAAKIQPAFGIGVHRFYSNEILDCVKEYSGTLEVVA